VKAIGYIRVSTDEQAREGISLAAQEAKLRAYAELYDLELVAIVTDAGLSAKTLNRPGLSQALAALDAGEAEALVIAKLDRLTRSVTDWGTLIDRYFAKRCALLSVADQIDTRTAAGRLVLNVLVSVAQWEREAIGERTATALAHKKAMGEHVGAPAYGFAVEGAELVRVEAELEAIGLAKKLRAEGLTLQAVADELNRRGITTKRGSKWAPTQVKRITER
jgi:DNA invertase Pin-like site-specific DNA recombinase